MKELSAGEAYTAPAVEVAVTLRTDTSRGLTDEEARLRLESMGPNEVRVETRPGTGQLLARQFSSAIVWVLLLAGIASAFLADWSDSAAILAIVVLNAAIGFYQEYRAENALAALRALTAPAATVRRAGKTQRIPAAEVAAGDILLLAAGDVVAADGRLLESASLRVSESALTGESAPVDKEAGLVLDRDAPLAERANMVYMGANVNGGRGRAIVTATGMATEMGRIAALLEHRRDDRTPLQKRLDQVGSVLLYASLGTVALVFILGLWRGEPPFAMFMTAISLAVAAVPEGLPAVVTIALALGVSRMAKRNALIRRLPAVETLGSTQVICTDKTGTLTRGEMTVRALWIGGREIEVTGDGYMPVGEFREAGEPLDPDSDEMLRELLFAGAACSEGALSDDGKFIGDPTEGAVLVAAAKAGIRRPALEKTNARIRNIPFDSDRKRATVVRSAEEGPTVYVKGAPESLLERCSDWMGFDGTKEPLTDESRRLVRTTCDRMGGWGLRVVGVAARSIGEQDARQLEADSIEEGLTLAGLMAMYDPPRVEAREAVEKCRRAGIRALMITGDHPVTAGTIGREIGILSDSDGVLTGTELRAIPDENVTKRLDSVGVVARVTAEDKLRIIRALRSKQKVVAMTGDGVNDAPALKEADIGIAMGVTGTEVTKQASDMVIADDNFATIISAVEEGRGIFENIKKCLLYLLCGNTAEILFMLAAILIAWPLPLLPLHLLWINLITDGLPALALAADRPNPGLLDRPPRKSGDRIAGRRDLATVAFGGVMTAGVGLAAFWWGLGTDGTVETARTYAFCAVVACELLKSLAFQSLTEPLFSAPPSPRLLAVVSLSIVWQIGITQIPVLAKLYQISSPPLGRIALLVILSAVPLAALEARKLLTHRTGLHATRESSKPWMA